MLQHSIKSTSKLHGSKTDVHDLPYSTATKFLVEIINFLVYKLISAEPVQTLPHTLPHPSRKWPPPHMEKLRFVLSPRRNYMVANGLKKFPSDTMLFLFASRLLCKPCQEIIFLATILTSAPQRIFFVDRSVQNYHSYLQVWFT